MKKCSKCKVEKDESEFGIEKRSKTGLTCQCKECYNQYRRSYLDKDRDRARKNSLRWYYKYNDKICEERREKSKKYREENREKINSYQKGWRENHLEELRERAKKYRQLSENKKKRNEKRAYAKENNSTDNWQKITARKILQNAVRLKFLVRPSTCEKCMKECKPHGHHEDYSKPLEVMWLCKVCHNHQHGKLLDVTP